MPPAPATASSPKPIIRVEGVRIAYGDHTILRDISFSVAPGEVFGILGGSGCGKSTLMRHLIGLQRPAAGRIEVAGHDVAAATGESRRRFLAGIGVMYQMGALFGAMTLLENVRLPLEEFTRLPPDACNAVARLKLGLVGLGDYGDHYPSEISGGMRKRAAIARAMALDPHLLFLDEPSAGLDPITSAELDALVLELARSLGITFVLVTHELASIFAIADRVIMLDAREQTIVATGNPRHLRDRSDNPWVRQFFGRVAGGQEE